ncbi:MAG: hypothetical protein WC208_13805 [Gallionella sp.]
MKRLTGIDSSDTTRVAILLTVIGLQDRRMYGYPELFPYFIEQGLLTDEALAQSGSLEAFDELRLRYPETIPFNILVDVIIYVNEDQESKDLSYVYDSLSEFEQFQVTDFLRAYIHIIEIDHVKLTKWIFGRSDVLTQMLPAYIKLEYLDLLLETYRANDDSDMSELVVELIGSMADYPLFQAFVEATNDLPPLDLVIDRRDPEFLGIMLEGGYYSGEEVEDALASFMAENEDGLSEAEKEVFRRYGFQVL